MSAGVLVLLVATLVGCAAGLRARPDPLTASERHDLGLAYYARGEPGRAAEEFQRALALRPRWAVALQHLGDARRALGDIDGALDALEAAHRADPDDPAIANNLAWALLEHPARWPEAERLVRTALTRDPPRRAYYLDTLGMLLLRQARPGDALDAFRQALADPELSDPRAREAVGRHAADALRWLEAAGAGESCTDGGSPPASRGGKGGESKDDLGLFEIVC